MSSHGLRKGLKKDRDQLKVSVLEAIRELRKSRPQDYGRTGQQGGVVLAF